MCTVVTGAVALPDPRIVPVVQEVLFFAIMITLFAGAHATRLAVVRDGPGVAGLVLGAVLLVSALARRWRVGLIWGAVVLVDAGVALGYGQLRAAGGATIGVAMVCAVGAPLVLTGAAAVLAAIASRAPGVHVE